MNTRLDIANTRLELYRHPIKKQDSLQAWDATDEYLIDHLNQCHLTASAHILIMNDNFGALCCWAIAQGYHVSAVNDSLVAQQNIKQNLAKNNLPDIDLYSSLDELPNNIDLVVLKLPKSNRLLIWQLTQLSALTQSNIRVVSGAKVKDIHSSTLRLFEQYLGHPSTSLAKKKSRLIFCKKEIQQDVLKIQTTTFDVPDYQLTLHNHPNVFSSQHLDIAAYLMLKHTPSDPNLKHIIDLGCGNGVLALQAAKLNPNANISAVDESHMAIASAQLNLKSQIKADKSNRQIQCTVNDCLNGFEADSADLILCNPPFHQLQTITDNIAWQMFCDAKRVLEPQGRIVVIGNRHLGYHAKLKRLFGNAKLVASNQKFIIVEATK